MNRRTVVAAVVSGITWTLLSPTEVRSQTPSCRSEEQGAASGYELLPDRGKWLLGAAGAPTTYRTLTVAQQATYEAIIHALDHHKLLGIVDAVTAVWGEECQGNGLLSTNGAEQFRLSVVLSQDAPTRLWESKFEFDRRGHVRRSNGSSANRYNTDSAREPGDLPKLQVSWLRDDPRIGEIDIDYRSLWSVRHLDPENSDVREVNPQGIPHYCLYRAKYGDELTDWWAGGDTRCDAPGDASGGANEAIVLRGWVEFGHAQDSERWPFRFPEPLEKNLMGLEEALRNRVQLVTTESMQVQATVSQTPVGVRPLEAGRCVVPLRHRRSGNAVWVWVERVDCEE